MESQNRGRARDNLDGAGQEREGRSFVFRRVCKTLHEEERKKDRTVGGQVLLYT
jgi:hypothetical protein